MSSPEVWGPVAWRILHCASWESSPRSFATLVEVLRATLPCPGCRASFHQYCKDFPVAYFTDDAEAPARWAYKIHDRVNLKLEKQDPSPAFSTLQRRRQVFGLSVTADDLFGFVLVTVQSSPLDARTRDLAPALADAFPAAFYAPYLRAIVPRDKDAFVHYCTQKRRLSVATQSPLETVGQLRDRCSTADARYVRPLAGRSGRSPRP